MENIKVVFGDVTLGLHGDDFTYIFSYAAGGLESLVKEGKEWLYRVPKPAYWRALTDNDRGNGFMYRSGMWYAADMFSPCVNIKVSVDGKEAEITVPENNKYTEEEYAKCVEITYTYQTISVPSTKVDVSYIVLGSGKMEVKVHYYGVKGLPELPVFGLRFIMPTKALGYRYEGLSGETYPDRMAGGVEGVYEIEGLPVTKYLVPQDCNVHMKTKWLEIDRESVQDNSAKNPGKFSLRFSGQEEFAFSCIPYTPQELENATHHEELPAARRTVVSILGAVRGVGGINSWGADTEPDYHIDAQEDICFSFVIS